MTNWYDGIVNDIKNAIETIYAKKSDLTSNSITNNQKYNNIKNGETTTLTLTTQKLVNDAINTKLGSKLESVSTSNIDNNAVTLAKLNSDVYDTTNGGTNGSSKLITSGAVYYGLNNHSHSQYVNPTIADNLTTNDATQVLSAKQGKVLSDAIGDIHTLIYGTNNGGS